MTLGVIGQRHAPSKACSCGERIVAVSLDPADVQQAVAAHNQTTRHQRWLVLSGLVDWQPEADPLYHQRCPCHRDLESVA